MFIHLSYFLTEEANESLEPQLSHYWIGAKDLADDFDS